MIRGSINTNDLKRQLDKLSKEVNKTSKDNIKEIAVIGARQLAIRTEPYGVTNNQKEVLHKSIYKDINKAYDYVGQTFNRLKTFSTSIAYAYANAVHNNDLNAAERYARNYIDGYEMRETDSGNHLDSVRNLKGRVSDDSKVMGLASNAEVESIKKDEVVKAGTAKAGWMQAGRDLSSKFRIVGWLKKSGRLGYSKTTHNIYRTVITLYNDVTYVSNLISDTKIKAAVNNAYRNQIKKIKYQIKAAAQRF